MTQASSCYKT